MVIGKRAQFFLLAAVIISAVVISLGISANRATATREPGNFYDFSYEVQRETGAVIDYEIYSQIEGGELEEFVRLLSEDIRDKNPDANFKFVYGNSTDLRERDFGASGSGAVVVNKLCFSEGPCSDVYQSAEKFKGEAGQKNWTAAEIGDSENFTVEVRGHEFSFPISRHRRVVFIMQKDVNDESFVTIK